MRILIVGGGGREHALAWAIAASPLTSKLYAAPGNAGIAAEAECMPIAADDSARLVAFAVERKIDFVVVGPEGPLANGLVDKLEGAGIKAFGPSAAAARIEASKSFAKDLCVKHGIPTARYRVFDSGQAAADYVSRENTPMVVKVDGLAAGKGVVVGSTTEETLEATYFFSTGMASRRLVIEERLEGPEVSAFALCDGKTALPFGFAQDHKRAFDGDQGPNTGGMGAYTPVPLVDAALEKRIHETILQRAVDAMAAEGHPFKGLLFAGLMLTRDGPKVLEFNARFGDPETQVLLPRLMSDILPALLAARDEVLKNFHLRWLKEAALTVVLAAKGYPGEYKKGSEIRGAEKLAGLDGVTLFHAGTKRDGTRLLSDGGRVLNVTALGATHAEARAKAYAAIDLIDWPEGFCRRDIGRTP
ncbi:MAG: phosphoribosylamine--glycine ligase [Alphaproteobacteria bacterium]|nr:phosphoribosylamine--glycine ligase [Alphaproteobacteria bacterium]